MIMKHKLLTVLALVACNSLQADPALTIYNQNFAVVRDSVALDLKPGVNSVNYSGATAQVEPESVILRDATGKIALQILEQSYRNDPADQQLLLKLFEGKEIEFESHGEMGKVSVEKGKIIRGGSREGLTPIIEMDGKLRFNLPGQPLFPSLGDNTILQPTFTWQLQAAAAAKFNAELAYVTNGFSWNADYNLVLPEKGSTLDVVGWVSVKNESGKTFENANIKLMAGDVQRIQPPQPAMMAKGMAMREMAMDAAAPPQVTEKSFDEYHLYSIARQVTLRDRETKQIEFARAQGVNSTRFYVYDGSGMSPYSGPMPFYGEGEYGGAEGNKKVASYVEFKNSKENHMGIALPKGRVRFYRADGEQLQFVGEAEMDHTPKDETLRFQLGFAFDLVGERKRTNFTGQTRRNEMSETFEIKVRNRKTEPAEIRVVEHMLRYANWEIKGNDIPFSKLNAQTAEFRVALKPDEEKVLTYTVRYWW